MSVYIPGMEMPQTCRDCPLEQPYDGYNCAINKKSYSWGLSDRPSDCPLVPVPPHGRLVDADALAERFWDGQCYFTESIKRKLQSAPTIIPAEEGE